jgi:hypothetical protein
MGLSAEAKDALTEEESRLWKQWDSLQCEMHKFALASQHYVGSSKVPMFSLTPPPAPINTYMDTHTLFSCMLATFG